MFLEDECRWKEGTRTILGMGPAPVALINEDAYMHIYSEYL